jgi:glycosyltransferase 2 family protein
MKYGLRRWVWLVVSVIALGLLVYLFGRRSEWHHFDWNKFWSTLAHARVGYLVAAVLTTCLTYLLRAYRWKFFLESMKKGSLWVLFAAQVFGFASIYLVGRLGEFVRPAYIAKKEQVSFSSQLALLLLERVCDAVFLVLLFAVSLSFLPSNLPGHRAQLVASKVRLAGLVLFLLTAFLVAGVVAVRLRGEKVTAWLLGAFGFLSVRARQKLGSFLRSFTEGLGAIRDWRSFLGSTVTSAALWVLNATVFWFAFQGLGEGLERLSWFAAALVMFWAAQGLVVQIPGVGGGYQVAAALVLTQLFKIRPEAATGASILVWLLIFVPCVALGVFFLLYEGLTFKKLKAITEEHRAAIREKAEIAGDSS